MIVGPSAIVPPSRATGARAVPAVAGTERQGMESRHPRGAAPGVVLEQRTRKTGDDIPFIDAEFVDVLREASAMARTYTPEDVTLRQALKAYRDTAGAISLRGVVLDLDT